MKFLYPIFILISISLAMSSCGRSDDVHITAHKGGAPLSGYTVRYLETDSKLGTKEYTGVTDANGKITITRASSNDPTLYYFSLEELNDGEDLARGGFNGGRRIAQWVEDGYSVKFE